MEIASETLSTTASQRPCTNWLVKSTLGFGLIQVLSQTRLLTDFLLEKKRIYKKFNKL